MEESVFQKELKQLINKHSKENGSNTPDFILASYLKGCLDVFNTTIQSRDKWWNHKIFGGYEIKPSSDMEVPSQLPTAAS